MDGRRALIYSRIRENRLNPAESDITRGHRQQDVIQALLGEMASFRVWLKLPFIGDDLMSPLTTDLSAGQFMQLALVQKRSNREVRCRLGGTPQNFGGGSFIQLDEEARRTILAFRGQSAPQPPLPRLDLRLGLPVNVLSWILFGLIAGAVARLVVRGRRRSAVWRRSPSGSSGR